MESKILAKKIAELAAEVKAINIKILDLTKLSAFTDFFVVCTGSSNRQVCAIADKVVEELKKQDVRPHSKEGYEQGDWVLVDYSDVVLHVFSEESRKHYDLEGFWERAPAMGAKEKKPSKARAKGIRKKASIKKRKPANANRPSKKVPAKKKSKASAVKKKKK